MLESCADPFNVHGSCTLAPTETEVLREAIKFAVADEFITPDGAERMLAMLNAEPN